MSFKYLWFADETGRKRKGLERIRRGEMKSVRFF
jgi:hypothetical protein